HSPSETGEYGLPGAPPRPRSEPSDHLRRPAATVLGLDRPPLFISSDRIRSRDPSSSQSRPPRSVSDDPPRRPAATVLGRVEPPHLTSSDRNRSRAPCPAQPRPPESVRAGLRR